MRTQTRSAEQSPDQKNHPSSPFSIVNTKLLTKKKHSYRFKPLNFGVACYSVIANQYTLLLEKEMATHSSILAWEIPRTEDAGGL